MARGGLGGLVGLLALGVFLAGCSSSNDSGAADAPGPLEVWAVGGGGQDTDRFDPSSRSAKVGDTVTFIVKSGSHTVDFDQAEGLSSYSSGNLDPGATFKATFSKAGTFSYHCEYHLPGMVGTITVS